MLIACFEDIHVFVSKEKANWKFRKKQSVKRFSRDKRFVE
jgi:hypothetical protein